MPITILCAADLWGSKVNYELPFDRPPTATELQLKVENVFAPEHAARRPPDVPPVQGFVIERMQTFDERAQQWVDLITPAQLQDYSQVYLFQKENEYHREVQSKIPPPVPAPITRSLASTPAASVRVPSPQHPPPPPPQEVAPPPPPAGGAGRTIPFTEKQRSVFDELDTKRGRNFELEDFRAVLLRLRIDYPSATIESMFGKADANKDGLVNFEEWRFFSELYPTLLDSLYFRTKDYWTDYKQQQDIETAKKRLDELREREKEARMVTMQAEAESTGQEQKVALQTVSAQEAQGREREAKGVLEAAHEDTERGRAELRERMVELNQQKDKERQKQVGVLETQREVEAVQRRLTVQEGEYAKAEELLREMERRVMEQKREVDRHLSLCDKTRGELASAQGQEHLANIVLQESQKDTQTTSDRVGLAEQEVASRQEREREATACHRESQSDTARQLAKRDMEERELQACKERELLKRHAEEEMVKLVQEQERLTQQYENENMELNIKRRQVEEEERPLLEQELKLRELRDSLEENEARLRMEHRTFHNTHGRGGTAADTTSSPLRSSSPRLPSQTTHASPYRHSSILPAAHQSHSASPSLLPALTKFESAPALSSIPPPTRGVSPTRSVLP